MTGRDGLAGITAGLRASVSARVADADTAQALGSGDMPVLGTPRLLALAEAACVAAIEGRLTGDRTTVGTAISLEHRRATLVGADVEVEAELVEVIGRRLRFNFIAYGPGEGRGGPGEGRGGSGEGRGGSGEGRGGSGEGEDTVIGAGTAERIVVYRERFLASAGKRPEPAGS